MEDEALMLDGALELGDKLGLLLGEDAELEGPDLLIEDDDEALTAELGLDAVELELILDPVEELELQLDATKFGFWYMLSRTDPPQDSVVFPLQVLLQPVATSADPELMTCPQKHCY